MAVEIILCCNGMGGLKYEGAIQPFTAFGHKAGQMWIRGNNNQIRNYDELKYCPFCDKPIHLSR